MANPADNLTPLRQTSPNSQATRAAYCDVDGTLTDTTIVSPLVWLKSRSSPRPSRWLWLASLAARGPWWLLLDQFSRRASNRAIYANYRGLPATQTRKLAAKFYRQMIRPRVFSQALARLESFRRSGHRLVLVTGGLDLYMQPMAGELGADCLAAQLEERAGVFTGKLTLGPLTGASKADAVRRHAAQYGIDLSHSYALGDAVGDLAMLECAGKPLAVNPDRRLRKIAAQRGWPIEHWQG